MIHWDQEYGDYAGMDSRLRREFDRGEKLWRVCTWVLTGLLAALLFAAQVH